MIVNPLHEIAKGAMTSYRTATSSLRLLPDFIIIGSARSGTTSLYNYLVQHPDIAPALRKEVHFFDYNYQKGLPWYRGQFPALAYKYYAEAIRKRRLITGEASPYYMFHPYTPQRVAQLLPEVKLIALLRNPVERAFSHYCWEVDWGNERLSFEDAIEQEEERIRVGAQKLERGMSFNHLHFSYISRGKYAEQLERWFAYFPREQCLLLKSEDMYHNPVEIYKQSLDFLHIPVRKVDSQATRFKQYNGQKSLVRKKMAPETRERLIELFRPHNERLYNLLGKDLGWQ
jgi:hypothetical protein